MRSCSSRSRARAPRRSPRSSRSAAPRSWRSARAATARLRGPPSAWLPLGPLPDTPVATLSYTATLQALGMLCDVLLGRATGSVWDGCPELAERRARAPEPRRRGARGAFAEVRALDAVGGGAGAASARETALLGREGLRLPATGMETREYLHGPLEAVDAGSPRRLRPRARAGAGRRNGVVRRARWHSSATRRRRRADGVDWRRAARGAGGSPRRSCRSCRSSCSSMTSRGCAD